MAKSHYADSGRLNSVVGGAKAPLIDQLANDCLEQVVEDVGMLDLKSKLASCRTPGI